MSRPLMQHNVGQLEELFAKSKADPKALKQLGHELQYRQVPRAVVLLAEVQAAMYGAADVGAPAPTTPPSPQAPPPSQPDLWTRLPPPTPAVPPVVAPTVRAPVAARVAAPSPTVAPPPARAVPTMTVDAACKVLKTMPGATWESIEQTRRLLVQQSSPAETSMMSAERRAQALAEARRVNAAYDALSQARCGARQS